MWTILVRVSRRLLETAISENIIYLRVRQPTVKAKKKRNFDLCWPADDDEDETFSDGLLQRVRQEENYQQSQVRQVQLHSLNVFLSPIIPNGFLGFETLLGKGSCWKILKNSLVKSLFGILFFVLVESESCVGKRIIY